METDNQTETAQIPKIVKYKLGWTFTEDEERFVDSVIRKSDRFMESFGKCRCVSREPNPSAKAPSVTPEPIGEVNTLTAIAKMGFTAEALRDGAQQGLIERYRKPKSGNCYWYRTADLEAYREYLKNISVKHKK